MSMFNADFIQDTKAQQAYISYLIKKSNLKRMYII